MEAAARRPGRRILSSASLEASITQMEGKKKAHRPDQRPSVGRFLLRYVCQASSATRKSRTLLRKNLAWRGFCGSRRLCAFLLPFDLGLLCHQHALELSQVDSTESLARLDCDCPISTSLQRLSRSFRLVTSALESHANFLVLFWTLTAFSTHETTLFTFPSLPHISVVR